MVKHIARLFDRVHKARPDLAMATADTQVSRWIRKFSASPNHFAVMKIGGEPVQKFSDVICEDIAVLARLDLHPPVLYGWNERLTAELKENGIKTVKHKSGPRITLPPVMPHLKKVEELQGKILVEGLRKNNVRAEIVRGAFEAEKLELEGVEEEHYTGRITAVDHEKIRICLNNGIVPILSPIGYSPKGEMLNVNGDSAAKELVLALTPEKYIILTPTGGVLDSENHIISRISIGEDYQALVEQGTITGDMRLKVGELGELVVTLHSMGKSLAVHIGHPGKILVELFTDDGCGTHIVR